MAYHRPISVNSIAFEEESLPSGRRLLHLIFKQKFGASHYKWTPPWKGDYGVERLFFKALDIEEWNDYEGVWSKELRQASREIPSLGDIGLPVRIAVGGLMGPVKKQLGEDGYRVTVEVLSEEKRAHTYVSGGKPCICIDDLQIPWESLSAFLLEIPSVPAVSKGVGDVTDWKGDEPDGKRAFVHGDWEDTGVRFSVYLEGRTDRTGYQAIGGKLAVSIRAFLRKRLSDYRSLKRGFEEV